MKRKVKFQEGGAVEGESPRNRQLREMMERSGREGRRVGLAERARQREVANQAARRAAAAERAASQRADAEFTRRVQSGQVDAETMRRMGATELPSGRQDFTTSPEGTTRRGTATGREMVPYREPGMPTTQGVREPVPAREVVPATQGGREVGPTRPSASRALAEVATPRQMPLGRVRPPIGGGLAGVAGALATEAVGPLVNYGREYAARRGAEADARREANLQAFRNQELDRMRAALPAGPDIPTEMRNAMPARPDAAAERRAARPAPAPRPRVREMSADELNEMELRRMRAERQMEEDDARERMRRREEMVAAPVDIGAASARARGEQVGPPGDYNMKKGGIVKKKAGGMIAAKPKSAPKKMMKGGMVAKPKVAAKSKAKPMPFKKGGVIKKGKK